ncbi:hypothetical protein KI440_03955 [Candidatus Saccharibacteria bacterium TM7i]|nr:hypothetical protein KI440_03955 [Candidatus Saccharibacteria bacterium TM7i]
MSRYSKNRILPTILAIVVIIVAIAGLVGLARLLFVGSAPKTPEVNVAREALLSTDAGSSVTMNVRGPIVADENFRSFQIVVSPSSREVKTFTGYLDAVIDEESLSNNVSAYTEFVHALDKANLTSGKQLEGDANDMRGICATGRITQFIIKRGGEPVQTLWTSTCSGSRGSLRASTEQLSQLFTRQIPNAPNYISKVSL